MSTTNGIEVQNLNPSDTFQVLDSTGEKSSAIYTFGFLEGKNGQKIVHCTFEHFEDGETYDVSTTLTPKTMVVIVNGKSNQPINPDHKEEKGVTIT